MCFYTNIKEDDSVLNHIVIMGRLTRDLELRRTQSGTAVTSFSIACDRDFKDKDSGERQTDFIDVVAWRTTAEYVCEYFSKGRMAVVEGRLQIRDWTDKDGGKRKSAEILANSVYFGDSKQDNQKSASNTSAKNGVDVSASDFAELEDDGTLPF